MSDGAQPALPLKGRAAWFRQHDRADGNAVTYIELFFDLVFVFAITQLSHRLLAHLTVEGAVEVLILFLAVWWLWIFTSWATNWLDPDHAAVRVMLIVLMLGGLALSATIPKAFEADAPQFAVVYITLQIGRTLYLGFASRGVHRERERNFRRIAFYFLLSAPLWLAGGFATAALRPWLWAAALIVEYAGPWVMYRTPGLGASSSKDWDISGAHMAERCALFIIIALGESVLVTGATYAELLPDTIIKLAFVTSFIGSATMWWVYFDVGAPRGADVIEDDAVDTGRMARNAYTYLHIPIVAGIIVTAVADAQLLAQPTGRSNMLFILVTCGGPWLFLIGTQGFKWLTAGVKYPPLSHFVGMALLIAVGVAGAFAHWQPFSIAVGATGALIVTAVWEWFSLHGGWERWAPWLSGLFNLIPRNPEPPSTPS